jgi:hypothetical protein
VLSKKLSSAECTSLNGADRETQEFGGFRACQTFQIAVENDDPQVLSKLTNCLKQCRPTFGFAKDFFRRRPAVRNVEVTVPLIGIHPVLKKWFPCAALAQQHQGFVDRYAR